MNNALRYVILAVILILLQVLILNQISFLEYATPFLYIYFLIKLPISSSRNLVIFLGFVIGFIIDLFCYTPGINAAATTFVAFLRYPVLKLFLDKEDFDNDTELKKLTLGNNFIKYIVVMIFVHHATLISIEYFSYINFTTILLRILLSTILTFILIFVIEGFQLKGKKIDY